MNLGEWRKMSAGMFVSNFCKLNWMSDLLSGDFYGKRDREFFIVCRMYLSYDDEEIV
jgi:hypothetical protein